MNDIKHIIYLTCIGLLSYGLSSCNNEEEVAVNISTGLETNAEFLKLTDDGTNIAGQLSITSGSKNIQLIWNTDSICNLDTLQTVISSQNGRCILPIKWQKNQMNGRFGPEGTAFKAGVKIVAGDYSKYVPLIWAEKIDSAEVAKTAVLTRAADDLPRIVQITMVPSTVNMNYEIGGSMYIGLTNLSFATIDISGFNSGMNINTSLIPNYITASQMLNFKWNSNGHPSFSFTANVIAKAEGIVQTGIVKYDAPDSYIEYNGVRWSSGNLKNVNGIYQFAKSQYEFGSYWPTNPNGSDPCKLVSPLNTWRLPTVAEYRNLINSGLHYVTSPAQGFALGKLFFAQQGGLDNQYAEYMTNEYKGNYCWCLTNWTKVGGEPKIVGLEGSFAIRCVKE